MRRRCPKCARTGVSWTARRSCSRPRGRACPRRWPISPFRRRSASATASASPSPISCAALVGDIEDELRSALAAHFAGGRGRAAPRRPVLRQPADRRAGARERRRRSPIRRCSPCSCAAPRSIGSPAPRPERGLLTELAGDRDEAVAAAAVSLLIADSRRLDAFHEPLLASGDLPAEVAHGLAWTVAAALRTYLIAPPRDRRRPPPTAPSTAAAAAWLAALRRRRRRRCARRGGSRFASRSAAGSTTPCSSGPSAEGALPLFLAGLSLRTGLDLPALWELLPDAAGRGPAIVLRAAQRRTRGRRPRSCSTSPAARRRSPPSSTSTTRSTPSEARRQRPALAARSGLSLRRGEARLMSAGGTPCAAGSTPTAGWSRPSRG